MADRVPPHDDVAERACLGCVLLDQRSLPRMRRLIDAGHFFAPARGLVWNAMCSLADAGATIDVVLLRAYMERTKVWERVGMDGLRGLPDDVGATTNAEAYAGRVRDLSALRGVMASAQEVIDAGYRGTADPQAVMVNARTAMTRATVVEDGGGRPESAAEGVPRAYDEATAPLENRSTLLDCGIGGLRIKRGVPTVIGGRTSNGKSTVALNCAANLAEQGYRVLVFSLEDTKEAYWTKLACRYGGVDTARAMGDHEGDLTPDECSALMEGTNRASRLPIHVIDRVGVTTEWAYQTAVLHQQDHGVDVIVADYVQLFKERGRDETERTTAAMRGIVPIGRDLNAAMIVLSQMSRPEKGKVPPPPTIYDLRQSGEIEQAADTVVLIHWEYFYTRDEGKRRALRWDVAKRKNGPLALLEANCMYEHAYVGNPSGHGGSGERGY
ncbi:MAG: hypothetical protein GY851_19285 [bacterium]|nr:hypothetical protein [bacterium]